MTPEQTERLIAAVESMASELKHVSDSLHRVQWELSTKGYIGDAIRASGHLIAEKLDTPVSRVN